MLGGGGGEGSGGRFQLEGPCSAGEAPAKCDCCSHFVDQTPYTALPQKMLAQSTDPWLTLEGRGRLKLSEMTLHLLPS